MTGKYWNIVFLWLFVIVIKVAGAWGGGINTEIAAV